MKQLKLEELVEPDPIGSVRGNQYLTSLCTQVYHELIRNKNLQQKKPNSKNTSKLRRRAKKQSIFRMTSGISGIIQMKQIKKLDRGK